jgi:hypothetical protein
MSDPYRDTVGPAQKAWASHGDTCPNWCGTHYKKGRCEEGDRLVDALDAEKALPFCCRPGCDKPARWGVTPEVKTDPYDGTHACDACLAWACETYDATCKWFVIGPEPNNPGTTRPAYAGPPL